MKPISEIREALDRIWLVKEKAIEDLALVEAGLSELASRRAEVEGLKETRDALKHNLELVSENARLMTQRRDFYLSQTQALTAERAALRAELVKQARLYSGIEPDSSKLLARCERFRVLLEQVLPYARLFWRSGERPAACISEASAALRDEPGEPAKEETGEAHLRRCGPLCTHVVFCARCEVKFGVCPEHRDNPGGAVMFAGPPGSEPAKASSGETLRVDPYSMPAKEGEYG